MVAAVEERGKPEVRDRILDAAEELFAARGYDGVPVREIMRKAGLELGNGAYYFGRKEELLRQVIARRADDVVEDSVARLEAVIAGWSQQPSPQALERLIEALLWPAIERIGARGAGWRNYIRLISTLISIDKDQTYLKSVHDYMDPTIYKFLGGLRLLFPDQPDEKIFLSYYFLNGCCLHMLQETKSIDIISNKKVMTENYETIMRYLPSFFASGIRTMMAM